ncbi:MAG: coenzyme F420-0:L-glutamate ligase [Chloroflexi bacterium]|nr:coenzyme F420-0:L-glutamate ligase [Chloroflexota bacterium]
MIHEGDNLAQILLSSLQENQIDLEDGDVLVIAQKVISKAEGRLVALQSVVPSAKAVELAKKTGKDPSLVELILRESDQVLRSRPGLIIVRHKLGFVCANAGIDRSNINQGGDPNDVHVLLLPENPDLSAKKIRQVLEKTWGKRIGVLIIDSHGRAWRNGTVGISIGFSGLPGIVDFRGELDLFGYRLRVTQVAAVDELAAAASLLMGQVDEGLPVVHVRGFPYPLRDGVFDELSRDEAKDLFR